MATDKVRKPFYKKWWFWLLAIIIVIALTQCGDEEANNNETANKKAQTDETNNERDKEAPTEKEGKNDSKINAGVYKVGSDIPAGEYWSLPMEPVTSKAHLIVLDNWIALFLTTT